MAVRAAVQAVATRRSPARTIIETSPVKSSGSLGGAERPIQTVAGEVRALCLAAEEKFGVRILAKSPLFS
eukprot:4502437-Heterocapsa_arctica.AAC.1